VLTPGEQARFRLQMDVLGLCLSMSVSLQEERCHQYHCQLSTVTPPSTVATPLANGVSGKLRIWLGMHTLYRTGPPVRTAGQACSRSAHVLTWCILPATTGVYVRCGPWVARRITSSFAGSSQWVRRRLTTLMRHPVLDTNMIRYSSTEENVDKSMLFMILGFASVRGSPWSS
jgi:hypothetical protein